MKFRKPTSTAAPSTALSSDLATAAMAAESAVRASRAPPVVLRALAVCTILLSGFGTLASAAPELPVKKELTLQVANQLADAAQAEAEKRKATVVITVVDDGGYPIVLRRLDNTQVASVQVSIDKARTAAIYRRPSKDFEDQVKSGRVSALALAGGVPLQGGLPIKVDGVVVGAIAASGNTPQEDEDIAAAGLAALEAPQEARYFPAAVVDVAFSKGAPILEANSYKVHASRRDTPGLAEVHLYETDVIHVLKGSSTFIVGGSMIDPKDTAFGEIRGKGIVGGTSYALKAGDVMVVPPHTPHWFKEVTAPFLYYTVKPISR
jgi:glc operon protein GlcG